MKAVLMVILFSALAATMISPTSAPAAPAPLWSDLVDTLGIALSADGQYLVVGTSTQLRFYGRSSSTPLWTSGSGAFTSVAISADGSYVAASSSGIVYFWANARSLTGNPSSTWSSNSLGGDIQRRCLAISDDGDSVAACGIGPNVFYWAGATTRSGSNQLRTWAYLFTGPVEAVAMSDDGNHVAIVGNLINTGVEGVLAYWSNAKSLTGSQPPTWMGKESNEAFDDVAISDDGNYVVVASGGIIGTIYYWASALTRTGTSEPHTWMGGVGVGFLSADMSCDGDSVIAGALIPGAQVSGSVYFWGGARSLAGTPNPTWTHATAAPVFDVAINDAGTYMAAVDAPITDTLHFYDKQGNVLWENVNIAGDKLSISCDGKTLAVGTPAPATAYLLDTGYSSPCTCGISPIPEYPWGLALLAIFMVIGYRLIKQRTRAPKN
jgi:hypothetical protein